GGGGGGPGRIAVDALAVLLVASGSVVAAATETLFTTDTAPGCTVKVAMMVREPLGAIVAKVHGKGVVQSWLFETKVSFAGVMSVTATSVAVDGPAFVTTIV